MSRFALPCLLFLAACAPTVAAKPYPSAEPEEGEPSNEPVVEAAGGTVDYYDRSIALEPFLAGFPYGQFEADLEHQRLFFIERGDRYRLKVAQVEPGGPIDLAGAEELGSEDWSKRSLWSVRWHELSKRIWLHADAGNDEKMNLWTMDPNSGAMEQVTKADYVYGYGMSADETMLAYIPRTGDKAPFQTCLHVMTLSDQGPGGGGQDRKERQVLCDTPELTLTWSTPVFSPDNKQLFLNAQVEGDRTRVQLVRVDLTANKPKLVPVTDPKVRRSSPQALDDWSSDGDRLLFVANDDGYRNLYSYSRKRKRVKQLTRFTEDIGGAVVTDSGVFVAHATPAGTTTELVDPKSGKSKPIGQLPGQAHLLDGFGSQVLWTSEAPDVVFQMIRTTVESAAASNELLVQLEPELAKAIVGCRATKVEIPTFDEDPNTKKTRMLHAFLLEPKTPVAEEGRLALVRSFYGGDNEYNTYDHILCAAGLTVLSPAVRGSSGFGKEFYGLNDKDLGGDEIVDLFYAARWLEERTGLPSNRIGVYGRSHGGYAAMRAMTFPPETNGRNETYAFGFGLAEAGFSDIVDFYQATNIPDWVVLESGDPNKPEDLEKMKDRSPITHVERLEAPIFLLHGEKDWRVPVDGSRRFAEAGEGFGKNITYVEVPGQGHHIEGLERQTEAWQARFDFLMGVAGGDGAKGGDGDGDEPKGGDAPKGDVGPEGAD